MPSFRMQMDSFNTDYGIKDCNCMQIAAPQAQAQACEYVIKITPLAVLCVAALLAFAVYSYNRYQYAMAKKYDLPFVIKPLKVKTPEEMCEEGNSKQNHVSIRKCHSC